MNRTKLSLRRPLAILGAAVLGAAAAISIATSAGAHTAKLKGVAACQDGGWVVTWTVLNDMPNKKAKILKVETTPADSPVSNIVVDAEVPVANRGTWGELVGVQKVPAGNTEAKLKVTVDWREHSPSNLEKTVPLTDDCQPSTPPTTAPPTTPPTTPPATPPATTPPATPPATTAPPTTPPATPPPASGEPTGTVESTCDELIFTIENPEDGETITATFTPSTGEPKELEVAPGETGEVRFPGSDGLTVTVSADGAEDATIEWEKPEGCDGAGGGLPQTGVAVGGIAGGAGVLLAIGAGLFFLARRRRMTFTA